MKEGYVPLISKSAEEDEAYLKSLPPGFRFSPDDVVLVDYYLRRKVYNQPLAPHRIKDVQLYAYDPDTLTAISDNESFNGKVSEWYFFTSRDRRHPNGARPQRVAGNGFWKATIADKEIRVGKNVVGLKKTLLDDWVLCRVYKREKGGSSNPKTPVVVSDENQQIVADDGNVVTTTTPVVDDLQWVNQQQFNCGSVGSTAMPPMLEIPPAAQFGWGNPQDSYTHQQQQFNCGNVGSTAVPPMLEIPPAAQFGWGNLQDSYTNQQQQFQLENPQDLYADQQQQFQWDNPGDLYRDQHQFRSLHFEPQVLPPKQQQQLSYAYPSSFDFTAAAVVAKSGAEVVENGIPSPAPCQEFDVSAFNMVGHRKQV
ncbi:hypothetical protein F3Y22_tig00007043pilonHSYRG00094 [Hibiscus syriacus]|uniref:NAC domain-containing protein n=1 Tax=Hibiscus syriacus TaxID=106335 RepID=A0A6A3CB53_HIBSY|nr:hypothetical protein F3Y22_tig00007043pilonHSYRG00094 [Hibiscus syriacus]